MRKHRKVWLALSLALALAGLTLIIVSMLPTERNNVLLCAGLGCAAAGNLITAILGKKNK